MKFFYTLYKVLVLFLITSSYSTILAHDKKNNLHSELRSKKSKITKIIKPKLINKLLQFDNDSKKSYSSQFPKTVLVTGKIKNRHYLDIQHLVEHALKNEVENKISSLKKKKNIENPFSESDYHYNNLYKIHDDDYYSFENENNDQLSYDENNDDDLDEKFSSVTIIQKHSDDESSELTNIEDSPSVIPQKAYDMHKLAKKIYQKSDKPKGKGKKIPLLIVNSKESKNSNSSIIKVMKLKKTKNKSQDKKSYDVDRSFFYTKKKILPIINNDNDSGTKIIIDSSSDQ